MSEKKEYVPPKMTIIELDRIPPILCSSADDNPYWRGCWGESNDDSEGK